MKKLLALLLTICMVFALAACAGTPEAGEAPSAAPGNSTAANPGSGAEDAAKTAVRVTVSANPVPDPATGNNWGLAALYPNFYDSLMAYAQDGERTSYICEDYTVSDDGLTYVFTLKSGVQFHDGDEMKASDVVYSYTRLSTIDEGFNYIFKGVIADCTATGDYEVTFTLTKPFGAFLDALCRLYIVNEDLLTANTDYEHDTYSYGDKGDYGRSYLLTADAGSGPYYVTEVSPQNYCTGEMFADYIIPFADNAPEMISFINNTEAATVRTMLGNGELECSDPWQTAESINALAELDGVEAISYSANSMQQISLNNSLAPTDDANVRKALACLIDYDAIIENVFPGSSRATGPVNSAALPGMQYEYDYNPEKAVEYLNSSKYADTWKNMEIEVFAPSGVTAQEKIALMVQASAAQIGLNVKITSAPYATQTERATAASSTANMNLTNQGLYYNDPGAVLNSLYSKASWGTTTNQSWIDDPVMEDMLSKAGAIVDDAEREAAYLELANYMNDNCFNICLADVAITVAYRADEITWYSAEVYANGEMDANILGYNYWFHDWLINK